MPNKPLKGKTIVLTGTSKTIEILDEINQLGGEVIACPLIDTVELIEPYDHLQLEMAKNYDWIIFTSQNAVEIFCGKMKRHQLRPEQFKCKIAAVGSKTSSLLEKYGFKVSFMPTIYSADTFVKEFPPYVEENTRCLFIRGRKAKSTIKKGLPFQVTEWIVYDTVEKLSSVQTLIELLKDKKNPIIIFASPSSVDVFAIHIAPKVGWDKAKFASIGHITAAAITKYGAQVTYQPEKYTMQAVTEEIIKLEEINHGSN